MALAGSIKDFSLADIFQIITLQQKTGELIVKGSEGSVIVTFEKGGVVGADASFRQVESRLGQVLVRSGKISKFELKRALDRQQKTLQPLGTVLAEIGGIDAEVLRSALSLQIHEAIYYLLRWTDGDYQFIPKKSVEYDRNLIKPINTEFLMMEGLRITDEWPEIEKKIPSFQVVVRRVPGAQMPDLNEVNPAASEEEAPFSKSERTIFDLLDSEKTIQDLIDMSHLGDFDTCQTVYKLVSKGLVEKVSDGDSKKTASEIGVSGYKGLLSKLYLPLGILLLGFVLWLGYKYGPIGDTSRSESFAGLQALKEGSAHSGLNKFHNVLTAYYATYKRYPESLEDLVRDGFILEQELYDSWNHKYVLIKKEGGILLSSSGPDGQMQTSDDIMGIPLTGGLLF